MEMVIFQKPLLLLFHLLLFSLLPLNIVSSPTTEAESLVKWKSSLTPASSLNSWSVSNLKSLCNWTGIVCTTSGTVSEINVSNKYLTGSLAQFNFSSFSGLTSFNISNNNFSGPIPPEFQRLPKLRFLDLSSNFLSDIIPVEVGKLAQLEYLSFDNNELSGTIPYQISHLHKLQYLDLGANYLVDPDWSMFLNMPFLTHLNLYYNELALKFPSFVVELRNLSFLDLSMNHLTGFVPESVFTNLRKLEFLSLYDNLFQGPVTKNISKLSKLKHLGLGRNKFSGFIPDVLGLLVDLQVLDLRDNSFVGSIPSSFGQLKELQILDLSVNHLNSSIPPELGLCTKLTFLDIGNNQLSDKFPAWLVTLSELNVLVLRSNRFHGTVSVSKMGHPFPKLQVIDLSHNEFSGNLPIIYFNNFKAANNFTRSAGGSYYNYEASVVLTVKGKDVEVTKFLNIYATIDLSSNKFQGEIPEITGQLKGLRLLNLSHNSLRGHIPLSLGNMNGLESLDLSSNNLTGVIPQQLASLTFLGVLNLSENHLSGAIPQGTQFNTFSNDAYAGNSALCGFPLTNKCRDVESLILNDNNDEDADISFDWEIILMGYGSGLICGLSTGYIVFSTKKPRLFVRFIEGLRLNLIKPSKKSTAPRRKRTA